MRFFFASLVMCGLAACGPQTAPEPEPAPEPAVAAPAASTPESYIGLWAVADVLCDNPAWRFEPRAISTQGEVYCDFNEVSQTANGYAIQAMCTAEAPPAPFRIQLEMTDAPRTMRIEGGPWAENTRLVYCRPLSEN